MPLLKLDGYSLYYRLEGLPDRPLLLLVHPLGTDHGMWDLQMPSLLQHFRVLRLDVRGHGASSTTPAEYTIGLLAKDVSAVVEHVKYDRFYYCGMSMGGMIGQWLAVNHPQRIKKLILANTSPRMADPSLFSARRTTVLEQGMQAIEKTVIERFFLASTLAAHNPYVETTRATLLGMDPTGYANCCSALRDMDQRDLLPRIQIPTLVIAGDHDVSTPWAGHGDLLASTIPGAESVRLNAAHLSNIDDPISFTGAVTEFLLAGE